MALRWLQLNRPCVLELRQLKDYGGQPLIFKGGLQRRCVTEDVFNDPTVQAYMSQLLLIEVNHEGNIVVPAAPTVQVAAPTPTAPAAEPVITTPAVVTETKEEVVSSVPVEEASVGLTDSVSVEESSSKDNEDNKGFEVKRRRR